jgi:hypothetical protein
VDDREFHLNASMASLPTEPNWHDQSVTGVDVFLRLDPHLTEGLHLGRRETEEALMTAPLTRLRKQPSRRRQDDLGSHASSARGRRRFTSPLS